MKARLLFSVVVLLLCFAPQTDAQSLQWTRQLGTKFSDGCRGVSAGELGAIYLTGNTHGDLGDINKGESDAYVSKYDSTGALEWIRQFGTEFGDGSNGVSADGSANVYVAGYTHGHLGGNSAGEMDGFVAKYENNGTLEWIRQIGTSERDACSCVSTDNQGNVFIAGTTRGELGGSYAGEMDAFVSRIDSDGEMVWIRQIGTGGEDRINDISLDDKGNVYVAGSTDGSLGGAHAGTIDAFLFKYDSNGTLLWTQQIGSVFGDAALSVSSDSLGNVYISGSTGGLDGVFTFSLDAFIAKFDSTGKLLWTRQFGTNYVPDYARSLSTDSQGNLYVAGGTQSSLGGPNAGGEDAYIRIYNTSGEVLWTRQIGSGDWDASHGVSTDTGGIVYISGTTNGSLSGEDHFGSTDTFVAKFSPIPQGVTATADSFAVFRGIHTGGVLADSFGSDDSYLRFNPSLTINSSEAPVWLIFDGFVGSNVGPEIIAVDVQIESNSSTTGLMYTIEFWNFNTNSYDVVGVAAESMDMDYVENYGGTAADHVSTDGAVRSRIGWRRTGLTINSPWEVRLDQLLWNAAN